MKRFEKVMQKEVTRKEFLTALGLGVASIFGMGAVIHLFFGKSNVAEHNNKATYGSSLYGGSK